MKRGVSSALCLLVVLVSGCSTIEYTAEKEPMINFKPVENARGSFEYTERRNFYFFGLVPGTSEVNLTEIAEANGAVNGLAEVEIEEYHSLPDFVLTTVTSGFYCPMTVKISGKIIESPDVLAGDLREGVTNEAL